MRKYFNISLTKLESASVGALVGRHSDYIFLVDALSKLRIGCKLNAATVAFRGKFMRNNGFELATKHI